MNYTELDSKLQGRNRNARKIANNTYAERRGSDAIAIRLHSTDILTFRADGSVIVDTGGWRTLTTKARLNDYLPNGYGIRQRRGSWYWYKNMTMFSGDKATCDTLPMFNEGDSISPDGTLSTQAKAEPTRKDTQK